MTIETRCPKCQTSFRVQPNAVGKVTRCTKCKQPFTVAAKLAGPQPEKWHAQSPDGQQYGPVSKSELDGWVAEGRLTDQWQLLSDGEGQWVWAHEVYEDLSTAAPTFNVQTESSVPAKERPTFRCRKYPAMRFVSYFFYGLAVLTAISLLISLIGVAMFAGGGIMSGATMSGMEGDEIGRSMGGAMAATSVIFSLFMFIATVLYHGMFIALFVYAAESVRIILDIQQNTQETAHYTKYGFD